MKRTNSFVLLWDAIKSSRRPMWASIQVLIVITVILATIFFIAEHSAQPAEYNYGRSLLWAFTRYIGDPGKFAGDGPITFTGRLVASLIGIVGIMIFAVPAGLIGAGFRSAIEKELRKKHLRQIGERLSKAFSRTQDPKTMYRTVPRFISLGSLQANKNMTNKDVIDAVEHNPPFRLRNLALSEKKGTHASDHLVVEMFPFNTPYGSFINRNSNITIACPSSVSEAGIGNFAYYLALIGGFNYISKEIEEDLDEPISFYLVDKEIFSSNRKLFYDDLESLIHGENSWVFFIISSERESEYEFHFITRANKKTKRESTLINLDEFEKFYEIFSKESQQDFNLKCELDSEYKPAGLKNAAIQVGGGVSINALTIRVSSELAVWNPKYIAVCQVLANAINSTISDSKPTDPAVLKEKGRGYILSKK